MNQKSRDSNFELFRIVLMIMVISIHYLLHGGVLKNLTPDDTNYYIVNIIYSCIRVAVNCFVLISGYFGIKFSIKKLIKFELQILFYSISIFIIFTYSGVMEFNIVELKKSLTPMISREWWFITTYLLLYIISPYVNIVRDKLSKENYIKLLLIGLFFCIIAPTFRFNPLLTNRGFSLYNFIFLYLIGGYIRKYYDKNISKYKFLFSYIIFSGLTFYYNLLINDIKNTVAYDYDSIFIFGATISLTMFFKSVKLKSGIINSISPMVFGIYLIHDHEYVRKFIYTQIFNTNKYYTSNLLLINAIKTIGCIFVVCLIIEFIRLKILAKLENIITEKITNTYKLIEKKLFYN
ncbi:acyltransferase [Clostridium sp. ZBS15]|uniref:acyltransferase n=1 Tax=Clostridium sp. ZBS15 TaxID=2949969 RepID=UPI002079258E|nr:acyltransferase [Clostridium sp. ZBS15]